MYDLQQLREKEFPISRDTIYLNHAGISPIPERARERMAWSAARLAENPARHFFEDAMPMYDAFKSFFCQYLNAESPAEIIPVTSTNSGINALAQALPLKSGDNLCFADMEFPSNAYPWMSLERDGIEARQVHSVNGGLTVDALRERVDERTRVVAVSAVQFFSGHRTDLAALGAFCRERGIWLMVDAIQAIGHIPIDVRGMNIDAVVAGAQKSLMGPPGSGVMYVRNALAEQLTPRAIGPTSTQDYLFWLDYDLTLQAGAERLSAGTWNVGGMFATLASAQLLYELGLDHIDQHTSALSATLIDALRRLGYQVITPMEEHSGIVTFASGMDDAASDALVQQLKEQHVYLVKHWDKQRVPHLRCSVHCYNTEEELQQFIEIIKDHQS